MTVPEPLGAAGLEALAGVALEAAAAAGAAEVEAGVQRGWGGLARFAWSSIHQHVAVEDVEVRIRTATDDGRVGVVSVHGSDAARIAQAARDAVALARVAPPDPEFPGVAPPQPPPHPRTPPADAATLSAGPAERAAAVRAALDEVPDDLEAAGAYETGGSERAVVTSAGQRAYALATAANLVVVVSGASGASGWAEAGGRAASDVDAASAARRAVAKARAGDAAVEVPAGTWPVVLEPNATATLVQFLSLVGLGGRQLLEQQSFAAGRLDEPVCSPSITVVDDPTSPHAVGLPFDAEGTPTEALALIERGVLRRVVHDRWTGAKAGTGSTGHALPAPNPWGPMAMSARILPGSDGTVDDLVAGMERGLLVTRFHYTNVVHPTATVVTGMTRDGTFLVEDGRVVGPVRNLRFTQSILEALHGVEAISAETRWTSELFPGGTASPALRLSSFAFTSTTTF